MHPGDGEATVDDVRLETLSDGVSYDIRNDLGFSVRGIKLVLMEAQTTFSINIMPRMIACLGRTWEAEANRRPGGFHTTRRADIPEPEFLLAYTGMSDVKGEYRLSEDFFPKREWEAPCLKMRMKVITERAGGCVVAEYVRMANRLSEAKASAKDKEDEYPLMLLAFKKCIAEGCLARYLKGVDFEGIVRGMQHMFDSEIAMAQEMEVAMYESRTEGLAEGEAKGIEIGRSEAIIEMAKAMVADGFKLAKISQLTGLPVEAIARL